MRGIHFCELYHTRLRTLTEEEKRRKELIKELFKTTLLRDGQDFNDIMKEFIAEMVNGTLGGEMDDELGYSKFDVGNKQTDNSRNGFGHKTLQTSYGEVDIKMLRYRQGEFELKLVGKHKTMLNDEVERKIIFMYAKGMTTGDKDIPLVLPSQSSNAYALSCSYECNMKKMYRGRVLYPSPPPNSIGKLPYIVIYYTQRSIMRQSQTSIKEAAEVKKTIK